MAARVSEHISESDHATVPGRITRSVRNWQHYRTALGLLMPTDDAIETHISPPPDWLGGYDFSLAQLRSPLQLFFRDASDPGNRAMWGVRRSDRPQAWANWKALAVDNGDEPIVDAQTRTVLWQDLWNGVDLELRASPQAVAKTLHIKRPGTQLNFRFALRLPNSGFVQTGDVLSIRDGAGVEQLRTTPLWAIDAAGTTIRAAFVAAAPITVGGNTYPTFRVILHSGDMANAVYPVTCDPTTTVSGTTDVTDANLRSGLPTNNYGGNIASIGLYSATSGQRNAVIKAATSAIPASGNTITAVRLIIKENLAGAATCTAFKILPANTWVEGNSNGANESGACDWSYAKDNSQAWAGSAGCSTSGTDYDASGVSVVITSLGTITTTLTAAWGTTWQTAGDNNGVLILNPAAGASTCGIVCSEGGAGAPYWEFDYTEGGGGTSVAVFMNHLRTQGIA